MQEMPSYEVPDAVDGLEKPEQLLSGELVPLWWDFLRVSLNPSWFQAVAPGPSRIHSSELPPCNRHPYKRHHNRRETTPKNHFE